MDFEEKIVSKTLTIYCSSNLKKFAEEFCSYFNDNINKIKKFLNIFDETNIIVALTDKIEEAGFVYGKSSFSGYFTDTGSFAYINLNGNKSKDYMFKGLMHELIHHLYKYYVYGQDKKRITWVDEGLAQFLSGQKDALQDSKQFKDFIKENLNGNSDINLNELNHDNKSFGNQNGYNLSYIAIRYLYEKLGKEEFKAIRNFYIKRYQ